MKRRRRNCRKLLAEHLQQRQMLAVDGATLTVDSFEVRQASPVQVFDLLANDNFDSDYAGEKRITSTTFGSQGGLMRVAEDGQSVEYEVAADFTGAETFEYFVDYEHRGTVTIEITSPLAADAYTAQPDGSTYTFDVLENDRFWEGEGTEIYDGPRKITAVSHTRLGGTVEVSGDGTQLFYTPPEYETGKDSLVYFVDDLFPATVDIDLVNPLQDDRILDLIIEQGPRTLDVLANDPFWDGYQGEGRITHLLQEENEWFSINQDGSAIEITPTGNEMVGYRNIRYVVDSLYEASLTVQIHSPVQNDYSSRLTPVYRNTVDNFLDVLINDKITYRDERFSSADPRGVVSMDLADRITSVSETTLGGSVTIAPNGTHLLYTPPADTIGYESFTYTVDNLYTATASLYINNPPTGGGGGGNGGGGTGGSNLPNYRSTYCRSESDSTVVDQNEPATAIDVLENDFVQHEYLCDPYDGPREITETTDPRNGIVEVAADGKSVLYTPNADFYGHDSFQYSVDGTFTSTVSIDVVRRLRDDQFRVAPDSNENRFNVKGNDLFGADYKGPGHVTSVIAGDSAATVLIEADRETIIYTPAEGFVGEDSIQYVVDGQLKATVSIFVSPSKDELLGRQDPDAFWEALIAEAVEDYKYLFGADFTYFDYYPVAETADFATRLSSDASGRAFSETNVQVAGVDEADLIETDGDNLYVLRDNELIITKAWPASELDVQSRVEIEGTPIGMYWQGDRLAVISETFDSIYYDDFYPSFGFTRGIVADYDVRTFPPQPTASETIVTVLDIEDVTTPVVVHKTSLDGSYVESRRIDDSVFLVMRNDPVRLPSPDVVCTVDDAATRGSACNSANEARYETTEEYLERISSNLGQYLPNFESFDAEGNLVRSGMIVTPGDLYEPIGSQNRNLLTVASINIQTNEPGISGATAVTTSGGDDIYASSDSLYIMDRQANYWTLNEATGNYEPNEDGDITNLLKFDWNGATGDIDFAARGKVSGFTLDQFAMDEHNGYFRIATTLSNNGTGNASGRSENAVWVLEDNGGLMQIVGDLQNVGLDETIESVRFMGDRAFVTTFREIDPLFALDLSDPTAPTRVGYVTLPGYNSYMQPIDANHMLTIGHNGITETIGSTQVILFDISDLTQPRIVGRHSFYLNSTSIAEQDHHAFGWFAHHGVLSIPLAQNVKERVDADEDGYKEQWRYHREDQLALLEINTDATPESRDGVGLRATIDNSSAVVRSAFIDDVIYSIAQDGIIAADISDPAKIYATVDLRPAETDPVDDPIDTDQIAARNELTRQYLTSAHIKAIDTFGAAVAPPVLVAMERGSNDGQASFVFETAGRRMLLRAGESHAEVVSEDFEFSRQSAEWQNRKTATDVNNDDLVTAIDALVVVNYIARNGSGDLPTGAVVRQISSLADSGVHAYVDVDGDGAVKPIDALVTLNYLNRQLAIQQNSAEGEPGSFAAPLVSRNNAERTPARPLTETERDDFTEAVDQIFSAVTTLPAQALSGHRIDGASADTEEDDNPLFAGLVAFSNDAS